MISLFIIFISVILASAFCSMSEAAILSLPIIRARILVEKKRKNAKDVLFLKENISQTIASIVIVNNAINIVGSVFFGLKVAQKFGDQWLGVAAGVLTASIIVVSEIIPKTLGERYKSTVSLYVAKPLRVCAWVFGPVLVFLDNLIRPLIKGAMIPKVTEEEIKMMLKLGRDSGTVEFDEEVLINRVFKLNDLRAFQIMKPIDQIFALPAHKTLGELREKIVNCRYSRIAVYDKDPKDFVGMVTHRVLLREIANDNYNALLNEFMTQPIFVNWFTRADELLEKFQAYHQHLFIVQNAEGKDVGLVTMEDVLEELFGEIYDEKDVKPKRFYFNSLIPENMNKDIDIKIHKDIDSQSFEFEEGKEDS